MIPDQPFTVSAEVYDVIYTNEAFDYDGHGPHVEALIRERNDEASTLLEVGAGTGLFLERFAGRFRVTGLDVSPDMLAVARRRLPYVALHHGDMRNFVLPERFDAVVCLFSSIGYMAVEDDLRRALANMANHLAPGGVLIVDAWLRPGMAIDGYSAAETYQAEGMVVARVSRTEIRSATTVLDMHHLVAREGHEVAYFVERHVMGLYSDDTYVAAMHDAGLSDVAVVAGFQKRSAFVGTR